MKYMLGETFRSEEISCDELSEIVRAAVTIPSGDNCQPLRLEWSDGCLQIKHDFQRAQHVLNHGQKASLITLGCMIEAIDIAASNFGFSLQVDLVAKDYEREAHWANIYLSRNGSGSDALYSSIFLRKTDRRDFEASDFNNEKMTELTKHPFIIKGSFHFSKVTRDLVEVIKGADDYVWENRPVYRDLFRWMRLTKREVQSNKDGMSAGNMGLNSFETISFRLFRRFPAFFDILWRLGLCWVVRFKIEKTLKKSCGFVLYTDYSGSVDYVTAGRRCYRFWLNMTQNRYALQPLTLASLILSSAQDESASLLMKNKFIIRFKNGLKCLRDHFGFSNEEEPVWMFRVGGLPKSVELPKTSREEPQVLKVKSGTTSSLKIIYKTS